MGANELHEVATARLRRDGQRYTANRRELVTLLADWGAPASIPDILRHRSDLAQSSVYRNLALLERSGVVRRIVTSDEWARYELAEDLTEHHHHLICSVCGQVNDFKVSSQLERSIESALERAASAAGFTVGHHRLDLVGVCRDCG